MNPDEWNEIKEETKYVTTILRKPQNTSKSTNTRSESINNSLQYP